MDDQVAPNWFDTHEVTNQPPPLEGYDVFGCNAALVDAVRRHGGAPNLRDLSMLGRRAGDPEWIERGRQANANPPVLRTHDRYGNRLDIVDFHPAYHQLMSASVEAGLHAAPWVDAGAAPVTEPGDRPWGQRTAYVADPDGYLIELVRPLVTDPLNRS